MNTEFDPLEAELHSLRPRELSPELKRRIADELASEPLRQSGSLWSLSGWLWSRMPRHFAPRYFVVASLAACLLAALLLIRRDDHRAVTAEPALAEPPVTTAFDAALPSVWQFHNAVNRSAGDLDAVLDQHAARAPAPVVSFVQIRGLGRSDSNIETLLGEL